jgi:CubicO group peptidase (beta-lactamase class C family)
MRQAIDQALSRAVEAGGIAGALVLVGDSAGTRYAAAAGLADPASGRAMTEDTVFQLASMTKAVTSVAAMQLVETGAIALDEPIAPLLPQLDNAQVIAGFRDSAPALRPAKRQITLRHLLTHTSGLGYSFMNADMARAQGEVRPGSVAAITAPLLFDPGEQWEYGVSTDWVGLAVEAASGVSLGAYMTHHIFDPLGMRNTGFRRDPERLARRATLLMRAEDGTLAPFPLEIGGGESAEFESGGGGLMGTGEDYLRFLRMLLRGGELDGHRVLRAETVAEMSCNQIGDLRAGAMQSVVPQFARPFDYFPDMHSGWGLGFLVNPEKGPNGRAAGSLAWAGIANTYYWIDPVSDVAAAVLMQFLPFGDPAALDLLEAVECAVYEHA